LTEWWAGVAKDVDSAHGQSSGRSCDAYHTAAAASYSLMDAARPARARSALRRYNNFLKAAVRGIRRRSFNCRQALSRTAAPTRKRCCA